MPKKNTRVYEAPARDKVLAYTTAGLSPREIARALDISTQRVHQHLNRLRELGELQRKGNS